LTFTKFSDIIIEIKDLPSFISFPGAAGDRKDQQNNK